MGWLLFIAIRARLSVQLQSDQVPPPPPPLNPPRT